MSGNLPIRCRQLRGRIIDQVGLPPLFAPQVPHTIYRPIWTIGQGWVLPDDSHEHGPHSKAEQSPKPLCMSIDYYLHCPLLILR